MSSTHLCGIVALVFVSALCSCRTERHLIFDSEPPGALVRVDGELVGRTPLDLRFEAYGSRHITMQREGYRIFADVLVVEQPWWSYFPLDFFSEILLPFGWEDIHRLEVTLEPHSGLVSEPDFNEMLQRAERLRRGGPAGPNQFVPRAADETDS